MRLQINKKITNAKSAIFAVVDSLNFYVRPDSLKTMNVSKLSDQIVLDTRKQFGDQFTKANLESVLNLTIKTMTTSPKSVKADKPTPVSTKKEIQLTETDMTIINSTDSLNKKVAELPHLWSHQAVLSKALGKSRQRIINAIKLAKDKQK